MINKQEVRFHLISCLLIETVKYGEKNTQKLCIMVRIQGILRKFIEEEVNGCYNDKNTNLVAAERGVH